MRTTLIALSTLVTAGLLTAPVAAADPQSDLEALLPAGYSGANCQPADYGAAAGLTCGPSPIPGAINGRFALSATPDEANATLHANVTPSPGWAPTACPGVPEPAATEWARGNVACGNTPMGAAILYTDGPLVGIVQGTDPDALQQWFGQAVVHK